MSPAQATYVYCVVQSPDAPGLTGVPEGLPGVTQARIVPLGPSLWLVAADAPLPDYSGASIDAHLPDLDWVGDRALAHEQVVEHFAAQWVVLPLKLFTLFSSDERAVHRLRERQEDIGRVLARIAGRVEWGVRILFQEKKAKKAEPKEPSPVPATTGKGFLLRKKEEKDGARGLAGRARAVVDQAYDDLARQSISSRRHEPEVGQGGARLLLDAAFLVSKGDGDGFEAAVQRWADQLTEHACDLNLTGPWPPYNFIEEPPPS
ncbi:MAG TPA: GvpL/GvpF family gas vesicle protein [Thermoanaerobaculia bacterium]